MSSLKSPTTMLALAVALGLALPIIGVILTLVGCEQPRSYCTTGHGDFAAIYTLTSGDPQSACGRFKGDTLGLQTYYAPGGLAGTPKFSEASMAIRPAYLGELMNTAAAHDPPIADPDPDHTPNAIAEFTTSLPDADEFCEAPVFSVAEVSIPAQPLIPAIPDDPATEADESADEIPPVPATTIRYEWSNARVLVSANYQGTQFSADLKFTQDGCTAEYQVLALYPVAACKTDADCQITENTAINPDFDVKCQTDLGFCVLASAPPALQ